MANHSILNRVFFTGLGQLRRQRLLLGIQLAVHLRHLRPRRERLGDRVCVRGVPDAYAAGIAFLQMKRWGHQWLIVTCWMGW